MNVSMLVKFHFVIYLLISFLTSCSSNENSDLPTEQALSCSTPLPTTLNDQIQQSLSSFPLVPGAVVAIYHPQTGYSISSYGVSSIASSTPMPVGGIFDIGSVHKLFKWILLEKLSEQGEFNFSDPINNYVTSPVISGGQIQHLANHSTGMVDIDESVYDDIWSRTAGGTTPFEYTYPELTTFLENEGDEDQGTGNADGITDGFYDSFTLGSDFNYSSYGPVIAGEIAEATTGQSSVSLINSLILDPLGMILTSFHGYDTLPSVRIQGYGNDYAAPEEISGEHPQPNQNLMLATSSAVEGALFSTGCDLLYFTRAISDSSLSFLTEATITSRTATFNDFNSYLRSGRGVMNYYSQNVGNFWGHAGDGAHGHSSFVAYNPTTGVSVVILTNYNPYFIEQQYSNEFAPHFAITNIIDNFY